MLHSVDIERARSSYFHEPQSAEETAPEGPCFARRDSKTGEPMFHVWRDVDGEWALCEAYADELTPDEVAALPAGERAVALEWRDSIEALAADHDPESCVHNAEADAAE